MSLIKRGSVGVEIQEITIQISDDAPVSLLATFSVQGLEYPGSIHELSLIVPYQGQTIEQAIDHAYEAMSDSLKSMTERLETRDHQKNLSDS